MNKVLAMCYDWRVIGGLVALAAGIWLYAPQLFAAALPLLFLLVCPLSMLFMARSMGGRGEVGSRATPPTERLAALEREQARLNAEIATTRGELTAPVGGVQRVDG